MPRPVLQLWRFDESEYDRPNQGYVCGKQAAGTPCRIGPDAGGACLATYECMPRKDGAHHRCTRPESAGGKCSEGPSKDGVCAHAITKCEPVRSWKAKRRLFSLGLAIAALVAGAGATFSRGPVSNAFVSPGPLSSAHAAADASCGDCHGADERGLLAAALDPDLDGERCVACHADAAGPHMLSPHGRKDLGAGSRRLDCSTCHPEHRGDRVELVRGGDATCRACHAEAGGSFASNHPEFEALGSGVARLNFDHTSKGHRAERCEACHVLDGEGRRRVLPGFEAACSRCHLEEIAKADTVVWKDPASIRRESSPVAESWESDLRRLVCRVPVGPSGSGKTGAATFLRETDPASPASDADPMTLPPPVPAAAIAARPWLTAGSTRVQPASFAPGLPATGEWIDDGDALSYRPLVHGDPVMREWLELVARHSGRKPRYKDDGGRCTVCHALAADEFPPAMAWTGFRDDSRTTRFSHRSHGEVACADCHTPSEKTFAGVTKAACSGCHVSGKAPDGCLTCHGYHDVRPGVPAPIAESVTGPAACEGCHATASKAWAASSHASSRLDTEERRASAAEIAGKLGVKDPVTDTRCTGCHATVAKAGALAGVSCESCHGAARAWIGVHADLGVADRGARAAAAGMIRANDAFALADGCLACHVVADPVLVAAGHLSGSPMDAVLWSQGEVRHGFGDGCTGAETDLNREMPASRKRTLFVTGALLDASRSLAALSLAPGPGDYADAMKTRVKKAAKKLRKAADAAPALASELTPSIEAIDALSLDGESLPADGALDAASAKAREAAARVAGSRSPARVETLDDAIGAKIKGAPWTPG